MARTVTASGTGGIDTSDFKSIVKALRKAAPQTSKDLRSSLRKSGLIVAVEAKKIAGEHSKTIPPTIKVRTAGATVAVVAGSDAVPIGLLFELGNTGGKKSAQASESGVFRHPVFGRKDDDWVEQPMHRFLEPAVIANIHRVDTEIGKALDSALRTLVEG